MDFDVKLNKLLSIGFCKEQIGMSNGKYSITYVQIDELSKAEFDNFVAEIN